MRGDPLVAMTGEVRVAIRTAAEAIRTGGWSPHSTQVIFIETRNTTAFAVIDTNSDGRELEHTFYLHDGIAWQEQGSNCQGTSDWAPWTYGYQPGRPTVSVT